MFYFDWTRWKSAGRETKLVLKRHLSDNLLWSKQGESRTTDWLSFFLRGIWQISSVPPHRLELQRNYINLPGIPNWYLNSPVFSKIWIRWLFVSATTMSSSRPRQKPCGELNCPLPGPNWPNLHLKHGQTIFENNVYRSHQIALVSLRAIPLKNAGWGKTPPP